MMSLEPNRVHEHVVRIPYVIDHQPHRLDDVLNALPVEHVGHSLDVATAYFNVGAPWLLDGRPAEAYLAWTEGVIDRIVYR